MSKQVKLDVVGLKHHLSTAQQYDLERLCKNEPLNCKFEREPENEVDGNSVKVIVEDERFNNGEPTFIGYLRKSVAPTFSQSLAKGKVTITVKLISVSTYWHEGKVRAKLSKVPAN